MVVLDSAYTNTMLSNGTHQYIQPESCANITSPMDLKCSPLAMLQKTCSQIGLDTSPMKKLGSNIPDRKAYSRDERKHFIENKHSTFKPYDLSDKRTRNNSLSSKKHSKNFLESKNDSIIGNQIKDQKSRIINSVSSTAPITRSGLEILTGLDCSSAKDLSLSSALRSENNISKLAPTNSIQCSSNNTANVSLCLNQSPDSVLKSTSFASTSPKSKSTSPAEIFPNAMSLLQLSALHKPGEKCHLPYCFCHIDPRVHGFGSNCVQGCLQCEQLKTLALMSVYKPYSLPLSGVPGNPFSVQIPLPPTSSSSSTGLVCSWFADGTYCGKHFQTSDELMQHLRTHTSGFSSNYSPETLGLLHPMYQASLNANPLWNYLNTMSHYQPYQKPEGLGLSPFLSSGLSPSPTTSINSQLAAAAAAFYSPYSPFYSRSNIQ